MLYLDKIVFGINKDTFLCAINYIYFKKLVRRFWLILSRKTVIF